MSKFFSPSCTAFYTSEWESDYKAANTWPDDLIEVSEDVFIEFCTQPPSGKMLGVIDGVPGWVDTPEKSIEEKIESMVKKKELILSSATQRISIWQTKLLMGRKLNDSEKTSLDIWMDYIDSVNSVDTSSLTAEWPESPAE